MLTARPCEDIFDRGVGEGAERWGAMTSSRAHAAGERTRCAPPCARDQGEAVHPLLGRAALPSSRRRSRINAPHAPAHRRRSNADTGCTSVTVSEGFICLDACSVTT
jgi:hypothetical protein